MHVGSGDDKKFWHLPEKLLTSKSTFFTAALEGGFAEGLSKSVALPEEDPNLFENYVEWLYVGFNENAEWDEDTLVDQWTLGDRLGCPLMQDDVMCKLIKYYEDNIIDLDTLEKIYEVSAAGSKIRQYVIDQCLHDIRLDFSGLAVVQSTYEQFLEKNEDFAQELGKATIFLAETEPNDPNRDQTRYLCAPLPPSKAKPSSGSTVCRMLARMEEMHNNTL